jgi:hypothetical protein
MKNTIMRNKAVMVVFGVGSSSGSVGRLFPYANAIADVEAQFALQVVVDAPRPGGVAQPAKPLTGGGEFLAVCSAREEGFNTCKLW